LTSVKKHQQHPWSTSM